jgi:polyisoprenoid-binding protein YceI
MRTALLTGIVALAGALRLQAQEIPLRPSPGSALNLYVEKTGLLSGKKHHFTFERFDGTLYADPRAPEMSRVAIRIEAPSIVCRDTWVSDKDKIKITKTALEDMLAASKYSTISFQSTRITSSAAGRFKVEGLLTIRDKSNPVTVAVEQTGETYTGEARFRLTSFGLKPPSTALGLIGTKDEVTFTFKLPATGAPTASSQ